MPTPETFHDHMASTAAGISAAFAIGASALFGKATYDLIEMTGHVDMGDKLLNGGALIGTCATIGLVSAKLMSGLTDKFRWSSAILVPAAAVSLMAAVPDRGPALDLANPVGNVDPVEPS